MITLWMDRLINLCKWPVALAMVLVFKYVFFHDLTLVLSSVHGTNLLFWLGLTVYLVLWKAFFSHRWLGGALPTFIHESIHALFAILTFHTVTNFSVTWKNGGQVGYTGGTGNWLITISPYFFPLATLLVWAGDEFFPLPTQTRELIFGFVFGFELIYVWRQIHPKQTDLQKVGWLFAWLFLPSAILISYGSTLHVLLYGGDSMLQWWGDIGQEITNSFLSLWQKCMQILS